jgi:hypothetical protein
MNNHRQHTTGTRQQLFGIWNFLEFGIWCFEFPLKGVEGLNDIRYGINQTIGKRDREKVR